jgi:hypothetical protein
MKLLRPVLMHLANRIIGLAFSGTGLSIIGPSNETAPAWLLDASRIFRPYPLLQARQKKFINGGHLLG